MTTIRNTSEQRPSKSKASSRRLPSCHSTPAWPYERAKPHPEPYLTGLKRFGATKEETLVVEDSLRGLKSAVAAGIDCAIVRNDLTHSPDFSEATYRIEALIELRDIVVG